MSELTKLVAELEARAESAEARIDRAEQERNTWHDKAVMYKSERDSLERAYNEARGDKSDSGQAAQELKYWHHQGLLYRARVAAVKALCDEMEAGPRTTHSISHAFAHDIRKAINEAT